MLPLAAAGVSAAPSATSATTQTSTTDLFRTFALPSSNDAFGRRIPTPDAPNSHGIRTGPRTGSTRSPERRKCLAGKENVVGRGPSRHVEQQALETRVQERARLLGDLRPIAPGQPHGKAVVAHTAFGLPLSPAAVGFLVGVRDDQGAKARGEDVGAVSSLGRAVLGQDVQFVADHRDVAEPVPHVGVPGGEPERLALAAPADEDRWTAGANGLGHVVGAFDVMDRALHGRSLLP